MKFTTVILVFLSIIAFWVNETRGGRQAAVAKFEEETRFVSWEDESTWPEVCALASKAFLFTYDSSESPIKLANEPVWKSSSVRNVLGKTMAILWCHISNSKELYIAQGLNTNWLFLIGRDTYGYLYIKNGKALDSLISKKEENNGEGSSNPNEGSSNRGEQPKKQVDESSTKSEECKEQNDESLIKNEESIEQIEKPQNETEEEEKMLSDVQSMGL